MFRDHLEFASEKSTFLVFQIFEAVVFFYKPSCALWSLVIFVTHPEF